MSNRKQRRAVSFDNIQHSSLRNKVLKNKLRKERRISEDEEIKELENRIFTIFSAEFSNPIYFTDLPLSSKTLKGLRNAQYNEMTEIQKTAIPHALAGKDILGAAKTGSGKTLAFLIPILEKLYRLQWNKLDGIGSIIISPTRELALQTFEVLRRIGQSHNLSAGLIIGGKDLIHEQQRINYMNILVCTPGRLLQHMHETVGFDCSNIKILVLDEADRILDLGFSTTVNAILENLSSSTRQTLLFSATQTKSVHDLARLSLRDPEYISVHEKEKTATPEKLIEHVAICELYEKLDIVYNFIKSHLKAKTLMFFSSCKQVRFIYEAFRRLRPGIPLLALHGKQKQTKRMAIFFDFCKKKEAVLFATDIAARGLDFPAVNWVLQVDCPEDVATYIHRVGRTARYESRGFSLLLLLSSEKKMLPLLEKQKIPVKQIKINPKEKQRTIQSKLASLLSETAELKYLAQKAFTSYIRSVWLQSNKEVFDVHQLPMTDFARSMGLSGTPRIKFGKSKKKAKNQSRDTIPDNELPSQDQNNFDQHSLESSKLTKVEKLFKRKRSAMMQQLQIQESNGSDSDEELFQTKISNLKEDDNSNSCQNKENAKERKIKRLKPSDI